MHSGCGRAGSTALCAAHDAASPLLWSGDSPQGTCVASRAHVARSCCRGGCVGQASTASVPPRELRWLLLPFSVREVAGCWGKVSLCPAHAHGVAGTREIADFPHCSETSQHLEMEAQPLRAELVSEVFKSSCYLCSQYKGGTLLGTCQLSTCQRHETGDKSPKWLCNPRHVGFSVLAGGAPARRGKHLNICLPFPQWEAGRTQTCLQSLLPCRSARHAGLCPCFHGSLLSWSGSSVFLHLFLLTLVSKLALGN